MHLGVMGYTVRCLLERVDAAALAEGDVYFVNHPEVGGNHLPDVKAVRPVFAGGRLWAFAVALAHWPDIGGALAGLLVPHARDLQQEGLVIPPLRLFDAAGERREALDLILANVRGATAPRRHPRPGRRDGDRGARLDALAGRLGVDAVTRAWTAMRRETAERVRRAVAALRDGVYTGEDALDDDGAGDEPVPIRCTLTIAGDHATFDFGASADQTRGPVNTTRFITAAAVHYLVKAVLAPGAAPNGGMHDAVTVRTRPGSVCDAHYGAPIVFGNHETSQRILDAAMAALAASSPTASSPPAWAPQASRCSRAAARDGRTFVLYETHAGGSGASAARAGDAATRIHMSNVLNTPAEMIEAEYPLVVELAAIRRGSGGAGGNRGGDGLCRRYRVTADDVGLTTVVERTRIGPPVSAADRRGRPARSGSNATAAASGSPARRSSSCAAATSSSC